MRRRRCLRPLAALTATLLAGCGEEAQSEPAVPVAELPHSPHFILGAQTHFGHNWPSARLRLAEELGLQHLRDGLPWASAEKIRGDVRFPPDKLGRLQEACRTGMRFVMTAVPRNPLYEENRIVSSREGQAAFLAYLRKLLDALPGCIDAIEIGNEINGQRALPVAEGRDPVSVYAELLAAIYAPLKRHAPDVAVLGGSTNVVGTGFLDELFARGLLDNADGIVVHPYRDHAENVDWELRHLARVMAKHGKRLPVWATEFSDNFDEPDLAAPALLKMVTLMGAAGVERAYWYALADQRWYRNMGLYTTDGRPKPASRAFDFVRRELLSRGRPVAVSRDPLLRLHRYGTDRWVVWGAARPIRPAAGSTFRDVEGRPIRPPVMIGAEPVVIAGAKPDFGQSPVLADSLFQYGGAPWSYHARDADRKEQALAPLDGRFATRFGSRNLRPLYLSDAGGAPSGTRERPVAAILRYTAPRPMSATLQACISAPKNSLVASASLDGRELAVQEISDRGALQRGPLALSEGAQLDIAVTPAGTAKSGNRFRYRVRLFRADAEIPPCPADPAGWGDA